MGSQRDQSFTSFKHSCTNDASSNSTKRPNKRQARLSTFQAKQRSQQSNPHISLHQWVDHLMSFPRIQNYFAHRVMLSKVRYPTSFHPCNLGIIPKMHHLEYQYLYYNYRILHRDVSASNILLLASSSPVEDVSSISTLLSFSTVSTPPAVHCTGAYHVIATDILKKTAVHSPKHDLEASFTSCYGSAPSTRHLKTPRYSSRPGRQSFGGFPPAKMQMQNLHHKMKGIMKSYQDLEEVVIENVEHDAKV